MSSEVEIAGPGFVNFHLAPTWLHDVLREVVDAGEDGYARLGFGAGERVQVEFVSANPTGPIHVGNGWFASYGDSVARLLARCGYDVSREYYVNDTGGQIRRLGESVLARRPASPCPRAATPAGSSRDWPAPTTAPTTSTEAGRWAAEHILAFIQSQMADGQHRVRRVVQPGLDRGERCVVETIAELQDRSLVWEEDGALWLEHRRPR